MAAKTRQPAVVDLFTQEPTPVSGCDVCFALFGQWKAAAKPGSPTYNPSKASDYVVEIGRHPHTGKKGAQ
ncbi:hypothetical protein CPT_Spernnie_049 [Streptomyces phage Spernnie]|jgi:hypothetical protein|uniref:Uncharacterized protein n=1 Tax=Streptomyces phage Spernnie TaxID=2767588 RepID=A0A873WH43_9CAUD|nr:hypothetical protein KGG74_gp49 [Streptomyces phage Spernnie]QPB09653.1 hypothetical protein CPT_Spernnie_049 [Streptomyces phage Spernnie]